METALVLVFMAVGVYYLVQFLVKHGLGKEKLKAKPKAKKAAAKKKPAKKGAK